MKSNFTDEWAREPILPSEAISKIFIKNIQAGNLQVP